MNTFINQEHNQKTQMNFPGTDNGSFMWILTKPTNSIQLMLGTVILISNLLAFLAIKRISSTGYIYLLTSLMYSNIFLCTGKIAAVLQKASVWNSENIDGCTLNALINNTGHMSKLLTLMYVSADNCILVTIPQHYDQFLDKMHRIAACLIWLFSMAGVGILCHLKLALESSLLYLHTAACIVVLMLVFYYKVTLYNMTKHKSLISPDLRISGTSELGKKAYKTTMLVLGAYVFSSIPKFILLVSYAIEANFFPDNVEDSYGTVMTYVDGLQLVSCLCDPIICVLQLREVRERFCCTVRFSTSQKTSSSFTETWRAAGSFPEKI